MKKSPFSDETRSPIRARAAATPDHPAYLIYTSGSTGTPKGIVITQRNICHFLRSANEIYEIASSDIVFQGASVAFDLSMEEIWIPYLVGATIFVATPQIIGETEALPDILEEVGVTVLDTVPTLLTVLPRDVKTIKNNFAGRRSLSTLDRRKLDLHRPHDLQHLWSDRNDSGCDGCESAAEGARDYRAARSRITHATSSMKNSNCCRRALKANCSLADRASRTAICSARS